jgi:putative membrane protein
MYYVLQHWSGAWAALAVWAALAALHLAGLRRLKAGPRRGRPAGRQDRSLNEQAAAFQGGLLLALLALISPIGYWSGLYIWVRSIQDLILALIAPGLIVLGAPWLVLAAGLRPRAGEPHPGPAPNRPPGLAGRPWPAAWAVTIVVAFNVVWLGWHLAPLYDQAATHTAVRYLEYACYLAAGTLFWLQLIGSRPWTPSLPPMRRMVALIATAAADTVLGMVLVFGSGVVYPVYRGASHHALTVVSDQQAGGAVLWMGVLPALIIAAVALMNKWLDDEESDELARDLDRVLGRTVPITAASGPRKAVWRARSGYRRPTIR